jgi:hypothetical protein
MELAKSIEFFNNKIMYTSSNNDDSDASLDLMIAAAILKCTRAW